MHTENTIFIKGDLHRIFEVASDVEKWPEILPHYRWVRLLSSENNLKKVEMAARRNFIPVKWVAVQRVFPEENKITYTHIKVITKGMEVVWTLTPSPEGIKVAITHDLTWPCFGKWACRHIVGEFFVKYIASKTLYHIKKKVESGK